jgi:hypothetical protein
MIQPNIITENAEELFVVLALLIVSQFHINSLCSLLQRLLLRLTARLLTLPGPVVILQVLEEENESGYAILAYLILMLHLRKLLLSTASVDLHSTLPTAAHQA